MAAEILVPVKEKKGAFSHQLTFKMLFERGIGGLCRGLAAISYIIVQYGIHIAPIAPAKEI